MPIHLPIQYEFFDRMQRGVHLFLNRLRTLGEIMKTFQLCCCCQVSALMSVLVSNSQGMAVVSRLLCFCVWWWVSAQ